MSEVRKVLGYRLYLEIPRQEKGKVILDNATAEYVKEEYIKQHSRMKVVQVGTLVGEVIKPGDYVFVDPGQLANGKKIEVDGIEVVIVNIHDVIHIWE